MELKKRVVKDYLFLHLILIFYSVNGIFSKKASESGFLTLNFLFYFTLVILNLAVYAILWQQVLKRMSLTTAFLNKSVVVIWGMLWGTMFFQEQIKVQMLIGAAIISYGIFLVVTSHE